MYLLEHRRRRRCLLILDGIFLLGEIASSAVAIFLATSRQDFGIIRFGFDGADPIKDPKSKVSNFDR